MERNSLPGPYNSPNVIRKGAGRNKDPVMFKTASEFADMEETTDQEEREEE